MHDRAHISMEVCAAFILWEIATVKPFKENAEQK